MRTPAVMIIGMVLAPCGLVLNLTSTVAPNWRVLSNLVNRPTDVVYNQGIWDICSETTTNQNKQCGQDDSTYFNQQVVQIARALMITSLVVTGLGIAVASWGVRCWEEVPSFLVSGLGGVVIFASGILSLIPVSWYTNAIQTVASDYNTNVNGSVNVNVGYALVLGYLGSCLEIIAGFSLMLCFVHCCKKCVKNKGKPTSAMYYNTNKSSYKNTDPKKVISISHVDSSPTSYGYSVNNDNYHHGDSKANSVSNGHRYHTNPMDVTAGERHTRTSRPVSQLSSLPWDSDLL